MTFSDTRFLGRRYLVGCALLLVVRFASAQIELPAQTQATGASSTRSSVSTTSPGPMRPLNGYAERLQSSSKRNAAAPAQPYNPIPVSPSREEELPEIEMFVGESRVFPTPGVGRIAVGNGNLLTAAALDRKEVILFANAVGTSSLFIWNEDGRYQRIKISVVPGDTARYAREISACRDLHAEPERTTSSPMDFLNRIKKEMSEGVVRAILAHAGYRVVSLGVEQVVREVECLTPQGYKALKFPQAIQSLPDLMVMDKEQATKHLVEVKYRSHWRNAIFDEIAEQTRIFDEIVLVYLNANPPPSPIDVSQHKRSSKIRRVEEQESNDQKPATYMRCCKVRLCAGEQEFLLKNRNDKKMRWVKRSDVGDHEGQWWGLVPLQTVFPKILEGHDKETLIRAIQALRGILDTRPAGQ